jgi:branched-chain amino acid transport system ATP-binding protein
MEIMNILEVKNLYKAFGKTQVLQNLSFNINEGEISSIIGPNGAGKTTLFNLCTGHFRSNSGEILYMGQRIDHLGSYQIVRLGIGRAFQICNIFPDLTVFENIRIPVISHLRMGLHFFREANADKRVREIVFQILENIGMLGRKEHIAGKLDHGEMKLLDIGIALSTEPKLLFLDEPTSGMTPDERKRIIKLIEQVCRKKKITLVLIEHDMDVVFSISQKIKVLNHGQLVAEGNPEEISKNPQVIEAYLGESIAL